LNLRRPGFSFQRFLFPKDNCTFAAIILQKTVKNMEYTAIIEKGKNGWYVAQCAQIPAAITQGKTIEEAANNLKEAIALVLECEKEESLNRAKEKRDVFFRQIVAL
jgi:predicted RNase H-like HicB family nuclease